MAKLSSTALAKATGKGPGRPKGPSKGPGRPKGRKNNATLLREAYQNAAVEMLGQDVQQIMKDIFDQAKAKRDENGEIIEKGDAQSQKIVSDVVLKGAGLGSDEKELPDFEININVRRLEDVIDAEDAQIVEE